MSKKTKTEKTPEQLKEEKIDKEVADKVEKILQENYRAIQPYLVVTEFGIVPRVRLARVPNTNEETNKEEK